MINVLSIRAIGARARAVAGSPLHLHGAIITPTQFIADGTLVSIGGRISAVYATPTLAPVGGIDVPTGGLMSPGFVDTHNHAAYAAFPRWASPSRYFHSRFEWRGKTRCGVIVVPQPDPYYATNISRPFKAITQGSSETLRELTLYGQVRGILGGATTMVIDADLTPSDPGPLPGFVREPGDWPGRVWGVLDIGCIEEKTRKTIAEELQGGTARLLVHVGEGVDEFSRGEFLALVSKDLLTANTAIIHALALLDTDWNMLRARDASVIWSPVSNFRLYGRSIDIGQALGAGVRVALAPDWTISGSSTVLDELAFVRRRYPWIQPEALLDMVTINAANVMGMPTLGRLEAGALADVLIFPADGVSDRQSAAFRIVTATPRDLRLALVGGVPVWGTPEIFALFPEDGRLRENVTVALPGGMITRVLELGVDGPFSDTVIALRLKLAGHQVALAPLWESA